MQSLRKKFDSIVPFFGQKISAFSLIEVLVVMTILALLVMISVPSFRGWINKETYNRQVLLVFDTLNVARSNMLSEKNCPTTGPAKSWSVKLTATDIALLCDPVAVSETIETITQNDTDVNDYTFEEFLVFPSYSAYTSADFTGTLVSPLTEITIEFLIATKQIVINDDFSYESVRIQLDYLPTAGTEVHICMNRYSQFSFLSPETDCSEL
jgi:prepilin-type N-terminal cleavage/methylation domain-containing protein